MEKTDEAASAVEAALRADPAWLAKVKETYDVKAAARPGGIPSFDEWVRETWAKGNAREASYLPGGTTAGNAVKIAKLEYFGDETVRKVLALDKSARWMAYPCEGEINYRFDTSDRGTAGKILEILHDMKCQAEIADDFEPGFFSVVGERPAAG